MRPETEFTISTTGEAALRLYGQTMDFIIYTPNVESSFSFRGRCGADITALMKNQVVITVEKPI